MLLCSFAIFFFFALSQSAFGSSDLDIASTLARAFSVEDDVNYARSEIRYAEDLCRGDTNRFLQIMMDFVRTNSNKRVLQPVIYRMGRMGCVTHLPFLYSYFTNGVCGISAFNSIVQIEGITSNLIYATGQYLSMTNADSRTREYVCLALLKEREKTLTNLSLVKLIDEKVFAFLRNWHTYSQWYDGCIQSVLPDYRYSKRRLNVLRAVRDLGLTPYNATFVTNAINELVSYPEADLPE